MNLLLLNTPAAGGKLEQALEKLIDFGMDAGKDILIAILIYVIGRFIIRQISALVARILEKRKIETSVQTFLKSLIKILLNMILAFAIIGKLGVETTSFAALLASAGVAVGMALSGNLSNFAGGLIILIFKPFKVGDYIDARNTTDSIGHSHHRQSESKRRTYYRGRQIRVGRCARQTDCRAAAHKNENHGSQHFCNVLFHNINLLD